MTLHKSDCEDEIKCIESYRKGQADAFAHIASIVCGELYEEIKGMSDA